ncbi:MAG: DUF2071 domain-containing protein [Fimbriimonadales bacterium]
MPKVLRVLGRPDRRFDGRLGLRTRHARAGLNLPLPVELKGRFSLVYDGGTLEHVFHFPQAIKNAMELVEVGEYFVGVTVCNNYVKLHGFYQFGPELFFRVFSPENGFETRHVLVFETRKTGLDDGTMWRVEDPAKLGRRVLLQNASETLIAVVARKTDSVDIFAQTPQQSDYVASWDSETGNAFAEKPRRGLRALTRPARYALKRGVRPHSRASTGVRLALKPYEDPAYTRVRMDVSALKWLVMNPLDPSHLLASRARPDGRQAMCQEWRDLLFIHWTLEPEVVQRLLPPGTHGRWFPRRIG